jgi:hypothetical protein
VNILEKAVAGLEWFGKEIGKGLAALPKIIRLTEDAEQAAQEAIPQVLSVVTDAGELVTASAKDSGVFLSSLAALSSSIAAAVSAKALNISADEAVAGAFENFIKTFNAKNVEDVITAWDKLASDTKALDATVLAALEKIKKDA